MAGSSWLRIKHDCLLFNFLLDRVPVKTELPSFVIETSSEAFHIEEVYFRIAYPRELTHKTSSYVLANGRR
jgi:hypothetical protein